MELRPLDDLFFPDWDESAVDSKFFDSLLRSQPAEPPPLTAGCLDALPAPASTDESSCSSAPSFTSSQSCCSSEASEFTGMSIPDLYPPNLEPSDDAGAQILAADPLLKTFLETGRQGLSRCFFFRSPASSFLIVAQSLAAVTNGRRFYDNLNMLEGLGLLKRGPVTCIEGSQHRLFTWYGNSFMPEDFRRLLRHGEETGLAAAVRAMEAGRIPRPDRFTTAVSIARREATTYALERRKPRGKCPLNVGIQRVLVILLAASRPLSIEAVVHLLQLPFPDVNLQRRYFYIRDVLLNFGLARLSRVGECKMSFFEYCGPALNAEPIVQRFVPLFFIKENVLQPLKLESCMEPTEAPSAPPQPSPVGLEAPGTGDIPASLLDAKDLSPLSENLPPCPEEASDTEEDFLERSCSNASSVLRRTDTMLPWTNSS